MTIVAHAAVSILVAQGFHKFKKQKMTAKMVMLYAFTGILPDLPLTFFTLMGNFTQNTHHHEWITHTPFFWIILALLVRLINPLFSSAFLIGGLSHLATDWYGGGDGIMFAWPFHKVQYGIYLSGVHGRPAFEQYFSNPVFLGMEILLFFYLSYEVFLLTKKIKA